MTNISSQDEESTESTPILQHSRNEISYKTQIISAMFASLGSFIVGQILGWSSPAHPNLQDSGSLGILTDYDLMWLSVACMSGLILGSLAVGFNVEKYGSRGSMLMLCVPCIGGWILMAIPQNMVGLGVGRFVTGFCGGGFCTLAPLYISEITHPQIRGLLTTVGNSMLSAGIVYSYAVGWVVSWAWLSLACGAVTVFFLGFIYYYLCESPFDLVEKKKMTEAREVLRWLYGPHVTETYIEEKFQEAVRTVQYDSKAGILSDFFEPQSLKPFLLCLTLFACMQLCGENAVVFYSVQILTKAGSSISPNLASIVVGSSQAVCVALSSLLIDKVGRRVLMFLSEGGMCISSLGLGLYFYFVRQDGSEDELGTFLGWVPAACLFGYMVSFSIGAASIPWLLMAELCPNQVRGLLSSLVSAFCWCLAAIVVGTFSPLVNSVGAYTVFWGYGVLTAFGCIFSIFFMPETKGRTLYEIRSSL